MKKVYLVGAGPGDPELITLKGRRLLASADAVLYDHLANSALLDFAPAGALRVYVGKKKSAHACTQQEICDLLIEHYRAGRNVVRLKGGDPFIFGRGGEEAEALVAAGIPFEVVPGVTSPLGIAAYTGVPLTHRDHTSVVTFVTGHDVAQIDWSKVGHAETLVILMGLSTFDSIARELIAQGRSADTPAMVVRWGTRPDQQTLTATLATLGALIHQHDLRPPATIIVGEVVGLRGKLSWFENLPLFGRRVVVTRPREQAATLTEALRALGAQVISLPAIEIAPASDFGPLDRAILALNSYDWVVFTSVNGVRAFLERLDRSTTDLRTLRARIAAIGPATQAALEALHLKVDVTGEEFVAESLLEAMPQDMSGQRILLARAAVAREIVPLELAARGAQVDIVEAYRTIAPPHLFNDAAVLREAKKPDWITFTSSSTVENLLSVVNTADLQGIRVASIGPVTSATLRKHGIAPDVEASIYTADGVAEAICGLAIIEA
jgi:uroporphyrinogen III methyltransferase/synthase